MSVATAGYTIMLMDPTKPPCTAPTAEQEQLEADPDHRAIMTCRNRLIALAVTGLAGMVGCGGRTAMDLPGTGKSFSEGTGGAAGQGSGGAGGGGAGGPDAAAIADARKDLHDFDALLMAADASVPSGGCQGSCQSSGGCTCT